MNETALEKLYTSEFPESVRDQLRELLKHRRALNTLQTYDATWRKWQSWARSEGLRAFPVSPQDLTRYLVVLNAEGATKSTVAMFMTVQRLAHKGRLDDPTGHLVVQETLKAIKRKDKRPKKQAKILSLNELELCCDAVRIRNEPLNETSSAKRCLRDRALLSLGWSGALRASEIVALDWEDITQVSHGLEIQIRTSKTDQESTGHMIALPWFKNELKSICPVRLLIEHSSERTEGPGAIFKRIHYDGSTGPRLSRRAVSRIVERAAGLAELPGHYSAHSLRRGFATWAAGQGATDRDIMRHGRWRSRAVMDGYVEAGTLWTDNALVRLLT
jgi:integrase